MHAHPVGRSIIEEVSISELPLSLDSGFLLLDPGALQREAPLSAIGAMRCTPLNWGADPTGLPMLVDLSRCKPIHRAWLSAVLQDEHSRRRARPLVRPAIFAHLQAFASQADIAAHIASQLLVLPLDRRRNRGALPALWRFFDPRVFANLCWLLQPHEKAALLAPISIWSFPWFDQWYALTIRDEWFTAADADADTNEAPGLSIDTFKPVDLGMWKRAERIAQINQVLARIPLPNGSSWQQRAAVAARIESALIHAKDSLHWHHIDDQSCYAEFVVRYGDAFVNHPKLNAYWALRETRMASGAWNELIALLGPDDLPESAFG